MVASGPTTFFVEPWNVLDFCIVIASVLAIALKDAPGFSLMRMVRLFRVIRMVEQFTQLRRIVNAIVASVVPMCSALFVLFLVSSIYSLVAVDLMGHVHPQFFGSYSAALFTMVQVCTFDDWNELARRDDGTVIAERAIFFVSYVPQTLPMCSPNALPIAYLTAVLQVCHLGGVGDAEHRGGRPSRYATACVPVL